MSARHVLISGGSRGIGAELVRAFAKNGDIVAFTYCQSKAQAQALSTETGALAFCCDARDEEAVARTADELLKIFHSLDVLISNAGTSVTRCFQDMTLAEWDDLFAVHVRGAFLLTRAFLPALKKRGGSVAYISSMWGTAGASCEAAYAAAKAALDGLAKSLAKELAPAIRVNAIAPGVIDTDMMNEYSIEEKAALISQTPLGRLGTPGDVAAAAVFLASPAASFITGQIFHVNGGYVI